MPHSRGTFTFLFILYLLENASILALPLGDRSLSFEPKMINDSYYQATLYSCGAGRDNSFSLRTELTIEMWLRQNWTATTGGGPLQWGCILCKPYILNEWIVPLHKAYALSRNEKGNKLTFSYNEATRPDPRAANVNLLTDFFSLSDIPTLTWTHVAVTYSLSSKRVKIYINGKLDIETPTKNTSMGIVDRPQMNVYFGGPFNIAKEYFRGAIDDVRIWSVARTQAQIQEYMNCHLSGNETGLVAYYPFAEDTADYMVDYSVNQNHCYPTVNTDHVSILANIHPVNASKCPNITMYGPYGYPNGLQENLSTVDVNSKKGEKKNETVIIASTVVGIVVLGLLLAGIIAFILIKKKRSRREASLFDNPVSASSMVSLTSVSEFNSACSIQATVYTSPIMTIGQSIDIEPSKENISSSWKIEYNEMKIDKELGRGAFGVVYLGTWRKQQVAIKQLLSLSKVEAETFLKEEAQLYMRLRPQQHVVKFLGVCSNPLCVVTEYIVNGSLERFLGSDSKMPLKMIIRFGMDIASGMSHLHSEGVIHRDLASRNLLLDATMAIKITDFGLSRVLQEDTTSQLTQSMTGPLKWMAPESLTQAKYSKKSDVWMFGVTMIEILTRKAPFPGMTPTAVAVAVGNGKMTPQVPNNTHPALATLVRKCFGWEPLNRPDFDNLYDQLEIIHNELK